MIVNLIKTKQMLSYTLPEKVKGQIWINDFDDNDNDTFRQLLSVDITGAYIGCQLFHVGFCGIGSY